MTSRIGETDWEQFLLYLHENDLTNEQRDPDGLYEDVVDSTAIYNTADAKAAHEYLAARGLTKPPGTTEGVLTADGAHTAANIAARRANRETYRRIDHGIQAAVGLLGLLAGVAVGILLASDPAFVTTVGALLIGVGLGGGLLWFFVRG